MLALVLHVLLQLVITLREGSGHHRDLPRQTHGASRISLICASFINANISAR